MKRFLLRPCVTYTPERGFTCNGFALLVIAVCIISFAASSWRIGAGMAGICALISGIVRIGRRILSVRCGPSAIRIKRHSERQTEV